MVKKQTEADKVKVKSKADTLMQKHVGKVKATDVLENRVRVTLENGREITVDTTDPKWEEKLDATVEKFKNKLDHGTVN